MCICVYMHIGRGLRSGSEVAPRQPLTASRSSISMSISISISISRSAVVLVLVLVLVLVSVLSSTVHYEYMALDKKTSILREAMFLLFNCDSLRKQR